MMRKWVSLLSIPVVIVLTLVLAGCCCPKKKVGELPTTTVAQAPEVKEVAPAPEAVTESALEEQARKEGALLPIYFDFDKYNIKSEAKANLDKTAEWLSKNSTVKIRAEGNCDERGTNEYNLALGERRASSAMKYLVNVGVSADRITTVSYGEEKAVDPGHDEAAWAKNRRDDFRITEK